jgi:FKBP-type peptidyl-prolyl cis-trans isomerase
MALTVSAGTKTNIVTVAGTVYTNALVTSVEPDGLTVMVPTGIMKLAFTNLSAEIQAAYGYDSTNAVAYSKKVWEARKKHAQEVAQQEQATRDKQAAQEEAAAEKAKADKAFERRARLENSGYGTMYNNALDGFEAQSKARQP